MADAEVIVLGPAEVPLLTELYNEIYRPQQTEAYFQRRFRGRYNVLLLLAQVDRRPVGFSVGYELMPATHFSWLCGVLPDFRRAGVATQLIQAEQAWARDHAYRTLRFECHNQHRAMLHLAITEGYDLVGIRWDSESGDNVAIFERTLHE